MSDPIRCVVCGLERGPSQPCANGHTMFTVEEVFGPIPHLKVPTLDEVFGADAPYVRAARDMIARIEGVLRAHAEKLETDHPKLWRSKIEGIRAARKDPKWSPGNTLSPLISMLSPYNGDNKFIDLLPYYPAEYTRCVGFRNAIMHEDFAKVQELGGARSAYAWIGTLLALVEMCVQTGVIASALLTVGGKQWQWPTT